MNDTAQTERINAAIMNIRMELTRYDRNGEKKIELLASFPVKECEYIGPVTSDRFGDDVGKSEYVLNCTSIRKFEMNDDTWYFFLTQEKVTYIIVFDFDDQLYPHLRRYNPRGTKRIDV